MVSLSERLRKFELISEQEDETARAASPELVFLCERLTKALSKKIAAIPIWFEYSKDEQQELILNFLNTKLNEEFSEIQLTTAEKKRISDSFLGSVFGFGPLDFLISQKRVSKVFVNSPADILCEINGEIFASDITMDSRQFDTLIKRLCEISGKKSSVLKFRFDNLLVTIIKEPVCSKKLILKKVENTLFNFNYFEAKQILNTDISNFLRAALTCKKRILISSPVQSGKTAFLNSFINELPQDKRVLLFEEGALVNTDRININRFDTEGLSKNELKDLVTAALYYRPEFIFADINDTGFNIEISDLSGDKYGFVSCIRADSPIEAMSFYTAVEAAKLKCTEKLAKNKFAKNFDYIIQLEKSDDYFVISSIYEISCSKSGSTVLTPRLTFKAGEYDYNLPQLGYDEEQIRQVPPVQKRKKFSFKARFE